jgi:hypothetical protein
MPALRRPTARLALTLVALATLIAGYYLGQYWQRQPLQDLSAVVYDSGRPLALPEDRFPPGEDAWRLFVTGDTTAAACADLLRDFGFARNRLAAVPDIQARLRLVMIAFDDAVDGRGDRLAGGSDWIDVIRPTAGERDRLAGELGILPTGSVACTGTDATAVLVSPRHEAWARVTHEQPAAMARNIRSVIEFVE